MMSEIALLITALLFGGSVLYAFGFAAFVFTALPARPSILRACPHFLPFVLTNSIPAAAVG